MLSSIPVSEILKGRSSSNRRVSILDVTKGNFLHDKTVNISNHLKKKLSVTSLWYFLARKGCLELNSHVSVPHASPQAQMMRAIMNPSDFAVYAWFFPVVFQIILPLVVLSGWLVLKLPSVLFGKQTAEMDAEEVLAS